MALPIRELIKRVSSKPNKMTITVKVDGLKEIERLEKATAQIAKNMDSVAKSWLFMGQVMESVAAIFREYEDEGWNGTL